MLKFTASKVNSLLRFSNINKVHSVRCYQKLFDQLDEQKFSPDIIEAVKKGDYTKYSEVFKPDEVDQAMGVLPEFINVLTDPKCTKNLEEVRKWMADMYLYGLIPGKKYSLMGAYLCYKEVEEPRKLTEWNLHLSFIMGWCVELLLVGCNMADDILDNSELRRGLLCWSKINNRNEEAVVDSALANSAITIILEHYFGNHPCLHPTQRFFNEYIFSICTGQIIEYLSRPNGKPDFRFYTRERHYEFSYCLGSKFLQSIVLSCYLANIFDPVLINKLQHVAGEIGILYNAQNDFLDFCCDEKETGKDPKDILTGKLNFYATEAWLRSNPEQKKIMEKYYGVRSQESVVAVSQLYHDLKLNDIYKEHEEKLAKRIFKQIEELPEQLPKKFLHTFATCIYKRTR